MEAEDPRAEDGAATGGSHSPPPPYTPPSRARGTAPLMPALMMMTHATNVQPAETEGQPPPGYTEPDPPHPAPYQTEPSTAVKSTGPETQAGTSTDDEGDSEEPECSAVAAPSKPSDDVGIRPSAPSKEAVPRSVGVRAIAVAADPGPRRNAAIIAGSGKEPCVRCCPRSPCRNER